MEKSKDYSLSTNCACFFFRRRDTAVKSGGLPAREMHQLFDTE